MSRGHPASLNTRAFRSALDYAVGPSSIALVAAHIVRVWKGYGTVQGVDRYCNEHFAKAVLPQLQGLEGFHSAQVLVRPSGSETQVVVATVWESIDSIKTFAGEDYEKAIVEPVVGALLHRFDDFVTHFTVAVAS